MKKKMFTRLLTALLTVALLLPCVAAVPALAAREDYTVLYSWDPADHTRAENAQIMKNNSVPRSNYEYDPTLSLTSKSNYDWNCTVLTEDGTKELKVFCIRQTGDAAGGLATVSTGAQSKTVEPPIIEMTELSEEVIFPKLYGAVALTHILAVRPETITEISILRDDDALFTIHTNKGNSWTVGLRNWTLLGSGKVGTYPGVFFQITSEDLVPDDIVLEKGERIDGITYKPFGESTACFRGGYFSFSELEIRGYWDKQTFEEQVPASRTFTSVPEETLRQIAVDEAWKTHGIEWTTDTIIRTENAAGQSGMSNLISSRSYPTNTLLRGPVYQRSVLVSREGLEANIDEQGKWTGGYGPTTVDGMDCATFVYNAISRVSQTNANTNMHYERDNSLYRLGNVKATDDQPKFTDVDVLSANDDTTVYEAYALMKAGDPINRYLDSGSSVHARMAREDAVVVRNPDGTIDPDKSYVPCIEQTSTTRWHVLMPDGTEKIMTTNDWPSVFETVEKNPGAKVLYGTCSPSEDYTFRRLLEDRYVAYSLVEYRDEQVKNANVQFAIVPNNAEDMTKGVNITAASYYRLVEVTVKLEDRNSGTVLYENLEYGARGRWEYQILDVAGLNGVLAGLEDGNYRLTVTAASGPVTTVGGAVPTTSRSVDFTVTEKELSSTAKLSFSADSLNAGQEVTVTVDMVRNFDTADAQVKFDADALTYVSGEVLPDSMMEDVAVDKGIVRIVSVGAPFARELAKLTFKANTDVKNIRGAVMLKSAMSTDAEGAVESDLDKRTQGGDARPSINMADVYPTAWYSAAVDYALDNGIMSGYNASTFAPDDELSRAMVVQVLYNREGQPAISGTHKFPDVKSGDWFSNAVTWGSQKGVIGGYGDGRFGPDDDVTIEQIAVILWNYSGSPAGSGKAAGLGAHSDWAADALNWAAGEGLFKDMPYETVTDTATRAQTAQMLMNFLNK